MAAAHQVERMPRVTPSAFRRRSMRGWRRLTASDTSLAVVLVAISALGGVGMVVSSVPLTSLIIPMVIGNLMLGPRTLPWVVVSLLGILVIATAISDREMTSVRIGAIVVIFIVGLIILGSSFRRARLGVAGARGESMLVDLRERLTRQSQMPELPRGWYSEVVLRSAGGAAFAGDFVVASKDGDRRLEVAVVDVSGKGEQAGTRSLLLSGSFGGLLGALSPARFLPAANTYLLRQEWGEGFATAVHLSLDLRTGRFELRSAGHPPGVQLHSGSGRWQIHQTEGPILGLMDDAEFSMTTGVLQRGDAMLLYTDGLVENPKRDISSGIDRLVGQAERLLRNGFEGGAHRLIRQLDSVNDDRALLLIHRR